MRVRVTILLLVLGVVVGASRDARAEKVKTNQETKLFSRPGEQAPVILTVDEGQMMTVLAREGRWIKVRVKGRTGYVPRSKVDEPEGEQIARNTRRRAFVDGRGKQRGFNGGEGPEDRVGADAVGDGQGDDDAAAAPPPTKTKPAPKGDDDDDDDKGKPAPKVKPKTKPAPKGDDDDDDDKGKPKAKPASKGDDDDDDKGKPKRKPASKGDDDDDDKGKDKDKGKDNKADEPAEDAPDKRPIAHVSKDTSVKEDPKKESDEAFVAHPKEKLYVGEATGHYTYVETDEGDAGYILTSKLDLEGAPALTARVIEIRGRLGITSISQANRATGSTAMFPDNYTLTSTTATLSLGGAYLRPFKKQAVLGAELSYDYGKSLVSLGNGSMGKTGFTLHNFDLRAMIGYDFHSKYGMLVFGRLGLHYEAFLVKDVENLMTANTADVPSESYFAPTIGAEFDVLHVRPHLGFRVYLDAVLLGSTVSQTKNLEDGATPTGQSVFAGGTFMYHLSDKMDITAAYGLNYGTRDFGPPLSASERMHSSSATDISRVDAYNTITVGVARQF
jgi:hypothetical protein